jgi:hypothetical protein
MPEKRLTEQKCQKVVAALNVNPNAAAVARKVGVALADRQEAFEGGLADAMARPRFVPVR